MIAVHRHTGVEAGSARIASHAGTGIAVFGIWIAVALVSSFAPRYVSGPDPSEIPIGAILAPTAGMAATGFLAWFIGAVAREKPCG
jgi:hypothetical protein